jgi:lysyl-tRNA synthetase class 2
MSEDIINVRLNKLNQLQKAGIEPFGRRFAKTDTLANIKSGFEENKTVKAAGRLISLREHG